MKLGILGAGTIIKDFMLTIERLNFEKVYMLAIPENESIVKEFVKENHLEGYYLDYDELLSSDVDTIYVALPNHLHFSYAKKALENYKNVIIEKPITANSAELKELVNLARQNGKIILEAMNIHYMPAFRSLKENIKQLGDIKVISFNYSQYSRRYDAFKEGEVLPVFDPEKAGGALMDLNVYNIHGIVGLFGKPQRINYMANVERGIDTSGILTLDYGYFKAVSIAAKDCKAPVISTLQGDKAYIRINTPINQIQTYELVSNEGVSEVFDFAEGIHRMYYEYMEFIRIIEQHDVKKAEEMMDISMTVSEIMEKARKKEKVYFKNDR